MKKPSLSRPGNGGGLHIVNCSLGKDSVALLIRMVQEGWKIDKVLFADLGGDAEFQETYGFLMHSAAHSGRWCGGPAAAGRRRMHS